MKKKNISTSQFVPFIVCLLPGLVNYRPIMTLFLSKNVSKGIGVTKSNVLRELVMTLLASTRVFHKINEFLIFVIFDVLILDNCRSQGLPLEEWTNLFKFFILQLMAFMSLEKNFFRKKTRI